MTKTQIPIVYEPHPVSPERKAALRSQGYRIVDIIYKPADTPVAPPAPATAQQQSQEAPTPSDDDDGKDGELTKAEIQSLLKDAGIAFPANAKKSDLMEILKQNGLT